MANQAPDILAQGYDAVYSVWPQSTTLHRIWRERAIGPDFPIGFEHISLTTIGELRKLAKGLRLNSGTRFVDLACGAGGPGLWVARETGARLVGIDFSQKGIEQARARASELGLSTRAEFLPGTFAETRLTDSSFDAAMSLDAIQYAPDKRAALAEAARILRPGARLAFYVFELEPQNVAGVPFLELDPVSDYRPRLEEAGFAVEAYDETPGWWERMTAAYRALLDAQHILIAEMGELAARALTAELSVTLERRPYRRRVFAIATRRE
jgi:SAM-dependent methyltransferase